MPILRARRTAATLADLILRVRRAVGDIVDDATPAAGSRKWEDEPIVDAINDMLAEMYQELFQDPDWAVLETTLTYTGGAEEEQIPNDEATSMMIYGVFETINGKRTLLRHVDYLTADRFRTEGAEPTLDAERTWSMRDDSIRLRPIPSSDTDLVIAYIGAPFAMDSSDTTDQHPFPIVHEELLVLGAANRLQYPNDQLPIGRQQKYSQLWTKWLQSCDLYQGARFPVDTRRYR